MPHPPKLILEEKAREVSFEFTAAVEHHLLALQHALAADFRKAIDRCEQNLLSSMNNLQGENASMQQQIRMLNKDGSPQAPLERSSSDNAFQTSVKKTPLTTVVAERVCSRCLRENDVQLRENDAEVFLRERQAVFSPRDSKLNSSPSPGNATPKFGTQVSKSKDASPKTPSKELIMNVRNGETDNGDGKGESGAFEHQFDMFELHISWQEELKSFADKVHITDKADRTHSPVAPGEQNGKVAFSARALTREIAPPPPATGCERFILYPTNVCVLAWSFVAVLVLMYEMILFPMSVFAMPEGGGLAVVTVLAACFWTCDFILTFFVAYVGAEGNYVIDYKRIARKYARSWIGIDILVMSVDWMTIVDNAGRLGALKAAKVLRYLRILRVVRILRLHKLSAAFQKFDDYMNSAYITVGKGLVLNIFSLALMAHMTGCIWYWIGTWEIEGYSNWIDQYQYRAHEASWQWAYLTSLHWSVAQFSPGGVEVVPQNPWERAYCVFCLFLGILFFASSLHSVNQAMEQIKNMHERFNRAYQSLRRYFREQSISPELVSRVFRYSEKVLKAKFDKVGLTHVELLPMLPRTMYMQVMVELYDQALYVHPLFAWFGSKSVTVLQEICSMALEEVNLCSSDVLFNAGQSASSMYFAIEGTLQYRMGNLPTITIRPTTAFCEAVLWTPWVHQGSMSTLEESELLCVVSSKFQEVVSRHHRDLAVIQRYAIQYVYSMNELAGFFTDATDDDCDLSDLLTIDSAIKVLARGWSSADIPEPEFNSKPTA